MIVFYARVSTEEQNEARQIETAHEVQAEKIFLDKLSGKNTERPQLEQMMNFIREGDTVIISEISRLARNTQDLLSLVEQMRKKGVEFRSVKECLDTTTPQGKFVLTIFAALGEFEREMIRQRQAEGIAIAKRDGKYRGRKPIDLDEAYFRSVCQEWQSGKRTAVSIAKQFGFTTTTFYKKLKLFGIKRDYETD